MSDLLTGSTSRRGFVGRVLGAALAVSPLRRLDVLVPAEAPAVPAATPVSPWEWDAVASDVGGFCAPLYLDFARGLSPTHFTASVERLKGES